MYIATKYIGSDYTPGEILPDDLPEAIIKRLMKAGAIKEAAPAFPAPKPTAAHRAEEKAEAESAAEEAPEEEEPEEAYEEPEAPEVDVTAALVEPEKPKTTRKKGAGSK